MPKNREKVKDLLAEFHDVFTPKEGEMGQTEAAQHHIKLTDEKLFKEQPWNVPEGLLEEVKEHLEHMLDVGAITPSNSAWSNAVILVCKKDGGLRFCIDFRKLNANTKKDAFHFPASMTPSMPSEEHDIIPLWTYYLDSGRCIWWKTLRNTPPLL